ncbi:MAG: hypothetical protein C0467_22000 [Planctomycetaceae bacterium]|nr:hypothetical protein [Planctomycetaceae bacterium]
MLQGSTGTISPENRPHRLNHKNANQTNHYGCTAMNNRDSRNARTLSSNTTPATTDSHAPAAFDATYFQGHNSILYDAGQRYSRVRAGMSRFAHTPKLLAQSVANRVGQSVSEVGTASDFYAAVHSIISVVGPDAKKLILQGSNPLLTPRTVIELADRQPEIIRAAIERASQGLHPFARPVLENTDPELIRWDNDLRRLRQAEQLLLAPNTEHGGLARPSRPDPQIFSDAIAIRVAARAIALELGTLPRASVANTNPVPTAVSVAKVRRLVEDVTRDFPLMAAMYRPTDIARATLAGTVAKIVAATARIMSADGPTTGTPRPVHLVDNPTGPGTEGGTYAVVMKTASHPGLRIGKLGTFRLPAGFVVYIGSAFGGGGVASRTGRHRNPDAPLRWNIDHLKAIAHPIELWWTHNNQRQPVECPWAMTLASLPGYCCPAPQCGGNDCKRCPAHLFHVATRPRCEEFVTAVRGSVPRHTRVYRQRLDSESLLE